MFHILDYVKSIINFNFVWFFLNVATKHVTTTHVTGIIPVFLFQGATLMKQQPEPQVNLLTCISSFQHKKFSYLSHL